MAGEGMVPSPLVDVPALDTEQAAHSQTVAEPGPYAVRGAGGHWEQRAPAAWPRDHTFAQESQASEIGNHCL